MSAINSIPEGKEEKKTPSQENITWGISACHAAGLQVPPGTKKDGWEMTREGLLKAEDLISGLRWYFNPSMGSNGYYFEIEDENAVVAKEDANILYWCDQLPKAADHCVDALFEGRVRNERGRITEDGELDPEKIEAHFDAFRKAVATFLKDKATSIKNAGTSVSAFKCEADEDLLRIAPVEFSSRSTDSQSARMFLGSMFENPEAVDAALFDPKTRLAFFKDMAKKILKREVLEGMEHSQFATTLDSLWNSSWKGTPKLLEDPPGIKIGNSEYRMVSDEIVLNPEAQRNRPIENLVDRCIWDTLVEALKEDLATARDPSIFRKDRVERLPGGGASATFTTAPISEETARESIRTASQFVDSVIKTGPKDWVRLIDDNPEANCRNALKAKIKGTTGRDAADTEVAGDFTRIGPLPDGSKAAYAKALSDAWQALMKLPVAFVFHGVKIKDCFGKTPIDDKATSSRLMEGRHDDLPKQPIILINAESGDVMTTIAHELAHVIGFNPTDCEKSGHFSNSARYAEIERDGIPKLYFDAYYFETIFAKRMHELGFGVD